MICDEFYADTAEGVLNLVDPQNRWTTSRDPINSNRGEAGSVLAKQKSVEQLSILQGIREGPCLRPNLDSDIIHFKWNISWATLLHGAHDAWVEDTSRINKNVQLAVSTPIRRCLMLHRKVTKDAVAFYCLYYNIVNKETTVVTILEIYDSTEVVEKGFKRRKKDMTWTIESVGGPAEMDTLHFSYANALYKCRWPKFRNFELCQTFKAGTAAMLSLSPPTGADQSKELPRAVWHHFSNLCFSKADFSHPAADRQTAFFASAYNVFKELKATHPEYVADVCMMAIPTTEKAVLGVCELTPAGLGNPVFDRITEEMVARLTETMENSECLQELKHCPVALDQKTVIKLDKKAVTAGTKVAKAKAKAAPSTEVKESASNKMKMAAVSRARQLASTAEKYEDGMDKMTKLSFLTNFLQYLHKIDPTQTDRIEAFKYIVIKALLEDKCTVTVGSELRKMTGLKKLKILMKSIIYRVASLKPRPSDTDFPNGELAVGDLSVPICSTHSTPPSQMSDSALMCLVEDMAAECTTLINHFETLPPKKCFMMSLASGRLINTSLLNLLSAAQSDLITTKKQAWLKLVDAAAAVVDDFLSDKMIHALYHAERVKTMSRLDLFMGTPFWALANNTEASAVELIAQKSHIMLFIAKSIGLQQIMLQEGPVKTACQYAPPLCHTFTTFLCNMHDLSTQNVAPDAIQTLMVATGKSWNDVVISWATNAWEDHELCLRIDSAGFRNLRDDLKVKLNAATTKANLEKIITGAMGNVPYPVPESVNLFPNIKVTYVTKILETFDTAHSDEVRAVRLLGSDGCQFHWDSFVTRMTPEITHAAAPVPLAPTASSSPQGPQAITFQDWWMQIVKQETCPLTADEQDTPSQPPRPSTAFEKQVVALLNGALSVFPFTADPIPENLRMMETTPSTDKKAAKIEILKHSPTKADTTCAMPFWGRVVNSKTAHFLPKALTIPMIDRSSYGFSLYIDGTSCTHSGKSDFCAAWAIPPIIPKITAESAAGQPDAEAAGAVAAAAESPQPTKKRKKKTVIVDETPMVKVQYMDIEINATDLNKQPLKMTFGIPHLVFCSSDEVEVGSQCMREAIPHDTMDRKMLKATEVKAKASFGDM